MALEKGIPYADAVARVMAAFSPKTGDILTHEQLRAVIQASDENRYRGVLAACVRAWLKKPGLRPSGRGRARGVGIAFLTGREDVVLLDKKSEHVATAETSRAKYADTVDTDGFTEAEKAQHLLRRRLLHENAKALVNAKKEIAALPPVVGADNVRLFKPSA
jgi:hypothetical protein